MEIHIQTENEYSGHWITTFSGKRFHYLDPQQAEIDINDISHALSLTCRFGGHCNQFYSVAEHSVRVCNIFPSNPLAGLLHDAHEAYLHDIPRPIKKDMPIYSQIADKIQKVIEMKYAVGSVKLKDLSIADDILLATEARDLLMNTKDWQKLPFALSKKIVPMKMNEAEVEFLNKFYMHRKNKST
jgi:hypothetical protein